MHPKPVSSIPAASPTRDNANSLATNFHETIAGIAIIAGTLLGLWLTPSGTYLRFFIQLFELILGTFLAILCLVPALDSTVDFFRMRWRNIYTSAALLSICSFLVLFLIHFGRWQYGGYDYNIVLETGWRQIQGQRPYVDFPTTTPPGFNLGILYAYRLFGVSWDATLYFSAIFACLTFLWMYWLLLQLNLRRLSAATVAFAIECAAMLTLCFWWYNNSTLILAAVFFLSCLTYASRPKTVSVQISYLLSLALLSLMKPNIAAMMIVGAVLLLFLITEQKMRLILLTLGATALAVAFLLLNHVSIPAMLSSYLSVAKEHGSIASRFGYRLIVPPERNASPFWIALLSLPLLVLLPKITGQILQKDIKAIALSLLFAWMLPVTLYGFITNGEYRDLECTVLLAAGGVLTFGLRWNGAWMRRIQIAILLASIASDLYFGAERVRVFYIGSHIFFEWKDNQQRIDSGYLKNMRVSSPMIEVERETKIAIAKNPGPYYFGQRMDFNYAVLGLPSPMHLPAWWEPGTSFAVSDQSHLIHLWQEHRFQTLIFLRSDYANGRLANYLDLTYYSKEFLDTIERDYVKDESYPYITVYHRREQLRAP